MKIVISEYSSGFAHYSYVLCNELAKDETIDELIYLTDTDNFYIPQINQKVRSVRLFQSFASDGCHKKGSVRWLLNRGFTTLQNCMKRNQFIKREKPDSVLVQATLSTFDCHFLKSIRKAAKVVLMVHDVIVPTDSMSWNMKSLKKMYQNVDLLVVHSKTNRKQLMRIFKIEPERIRVIPHGVKSTYHKRDKNECRKEINIMDDKPVLLFYGGIRKSKGLDVLIHALKDIDCTLVIAGKPSYGETFDEYRKLIEHNHVRTVEYIEFTDDAFRDVLFQASDYLVLPYKEFYSQSGVFMQAIQYHLPVIATNVSSFREFVLKYDLGFIAQPNNIDDLHKVIQKAVSTQKDYEANMAKAVAENCWEVTSKMYANILKVGKNR